MRALNMCVCLSALHTAMSFVICPALTLGLTGMRLTRSPVYANAQVLDQEGVGELIKFAVERGRTARPDLKIGICGEQGGEPRTVAFLHGVGLDYVSCSPFRVPIARLAAAQAAIQSGKQ